MEGVSGIDRRSNRRGRGRSFQNIGQLLFEAGHLAEARAGFTSVVSRALPVHILLAALGGLAITSAETNQPDTVEWATAEIERLSASSAPRYSIAVALLESAIGLHRIHKHDDSQRHAVAAVRLGRAHGFHEIVFRAESIESASPAEPNATPVTLTREAASVANKVAWLEPKQLPEHVALAVPSA